MKYWLLVADAAQARVFTSQPHLKSLQLLREIKNPKGRARPQQIVADEPGRFAKSGQRSIRSAMEPRMDTNSTPSKKSEVRSSFSRSVCTSP